MTAENEPRELRERIGRLSLAHQLYLFEVALGDYRRKCDEARAKMLQQVEVLREHGHAVHTGEKRAAG